jgi:hypothetical protein
MTQVLLHLGPAISDVLWCKVSPHFGNASFPQKPARVEALQFCPFGTRQNTPKSSLVDIFRPQKIRSALSI